MFEHGGVDINATLQSRSVRLLHRAAHLGNLELIEYLLQEVHTQAWGSVLNAQSAAGYTPLHWCAAAAHCASGSARAEAQRRYGSVARLLLESGSDPTVVSARGQTAWDVAHTAQSSGVLQTFAEFAREDPARTGHAGVSLSLCLCLSVSLTLFFDSLCGD